jgi:hypothetical protein
MSVTLAVEPPVRRFKQNGEQDFAAELATQDRHTLVQPLGTVRDVLLDGQARSLANGYRLTTLALCQVCQAVCPGLYRFLQELSGVNRMPDQARDDYSAVEALDTYNRVVRRRFATRLGGRQLVRDTRANLIVGMIGAHYQRLPNLSLYERTKALLARLERPADFYEATLSGRWLLLRYYVPRTYCTTEGPQGERDRYLPGYHFSNNEVGEAASVRSAAFLLREQGRTSALCLSASAGHVRHQGHTFEQRLQRALDSALSRLRPGPYYATRFKALAAQQVLRPGRDVEAREQARDELLYRLRRRHLTVGAARAVLEELTARDSYEDRPFAFAEGPMAPARTAYDLFNSLGRVARGLAISARERLEQVAYSLLAGQFSVT